MVDEVDHEVVDEVDHEVVDEVDHEVVDEVNLKPTKRGVKMPYYYNKNLSKNSQSLRKHMTPEEKHLWYDFLKLLPVTVNRQKVIGNYITDFYIHSAKVVIELDGIQHQTEEQKATDKERDKYLTSLGIKVLRYTNTVINKRFSFVCADILEHLGLSVDDVRR